MMNENKASELALKLEGEIGTSPHSRQAIEEAFLEMAAWKDKEMQKTIEVAEDHAFLAGSCSEREKFESEKEEIKTDAKKELALEIHEKITNGATLAELDHYLYDIYNGITL